MPTILGIPLDVNSSYLRGPARAPARIREAFRCDASNGWSESAVDVTSADALVDAGDLNLVNSKEKVGEDFAEIEHAVGTLLNKDKGQPILLGGDHSITYPILKAFAPRYPVLVPFRVHRILRTRGKLAQRLAWA